MIVSKLQISGFRGIRTGEVNFSRFNTFVGPNNCGKTTIVEALALVLGRDRLVRTLTEHDFNGSEPCRRRIGSVMQFIADIAMGRKPAAEHKMTKHANGTTSIWTFSNAVPGI